LASYLFCANYAAKFQENYSRPTPESLDI